MHRFFVEPGAVRGSTVQFTPDQSRQLRTVLRLHDGDCVLVLDGDGLCHQTRIEHHSKGETRGHILATTKASGEPAGSIHLYIAIARPERFEWALEKSVELGVTHIQPMLTARTVRGAPGAAKWERWQRIVREAAEQCGRGRLPRLLDPIEFEAAIQQKSGLTLLPSLRASRPPAAALARPAWPIHLFIGPEGGFTPDEIALARAAGIEPITLGPRTLRVETAAVVLLTLVAQATGELDQPAPRAEEA